MGIKGLNKFSWPDKPARLTLAFNNTTMTSSYDTSTITLISTNGTKRKTRATN